MRVSPFFVFKNLGKIVSVSDPGLFFVIKIVKEKRKYVQGTGHWALG